MGIAVASIVGVLALVVLGYFAFVVLGARASRYDPDQIDGSQVQVLRYPVPGGQDPVVVLSALSKAGYDAATDLVEGSSVVVVACPAGADRERAHVRAVIGEASGASLEGPELDPGKVTFEDEQSA